MSTDSILHVKRQLLSSLCQVENFEEIPMPVRFQDKVAKEDFEQYNALKMRHYKLTAPRVRNQHSLQTPQTEKKRSSARDEGLQSSKICLTKPPHSQEDDKNSFVSCMFKSENKCYEHAHETHKIVTQRRLKTFFDEDD